MRILQVCTNFLMGGIQRHVLELTVFLHEHGHTVVLAGDDGEWRPDGVNEFELLPLNDVAAMGGSIFSRLSRIWPVARAMRRALIKHKIEIIHTHETAPLIVAKLAAFGLGIPIVFSYHGSERERIAGVAKTARRCADATISPSHASLGGLIDRGLPASKGQVVGLGLRPLSVVPEGAAAEIRKRLLGDNGRFLISSLSRIDTQKGIDIMIEVARKVRDVRGDVIFAIGGNGPLNDLVPRWADVAGVSDSVIFLGYTSEVAELLAASDLYLLTSRWEALPVSIAEAFQCGVPVIATDCGGVRELVDDKVGRLLPVGATNQIAEAILTLLDDDELRGELGRNALLRSQDPSFTPRTAQLQIEKIYQTLLGTADAGQ